GSLSSPPAAEPSPVEVPHAQDARLEVTLFAASPDIVHPIGVAFDRRGRLLVIESHTHFRPEGYKGPQHDRIRILEDTDGDGRGAPLPPLPRGNNRHDGDCGAPRRLDLPGDAQRGAPPPRYEGRRQGRRRAPHCLPRNQGELPAQRPWRPGLRLAR